MNAAANDYPQIVANQLDVFMGMLAQRGIDDHVDYVIIAPGSDYRISATGLVADSCVSVRNFSVSSAYTLAHLADQILAGQVVTRRNEYFTSTGNAMEFDGGVLWKNGAVGTSGDRYFIGAQLGYDGERGNTVAETLAMIDRSVAVDGTRPDGTFYFMRTTDSARSSPRHGEYASTVSELRSLGAGAEELSAVLPLGQHDCLGIMTGVASTGVGQADLTILAGAFGDHLTSFAAMFGTSSQEKVSSWIAAGASGSWGAVEEPCNYAGKFPRSRLHVYYYEGSSLGEAVLRSVNYLPFQLLLYGDPLTQPFAYIPEVSVVDAPVGPVSGVIMLTPTATSPRPGGTIDGYDLYIDGRWHSDLAIGGQFTVDVSGLADGWHELRVVAYEASAVRAQGQWLGSMVVDERGLEAGLDVEAVADAGGNVYTAHVTSSGGSVAEIRVLHNGRVIAATDQSSDALAIGARQLGAGLVTLSAVAEFADGGSANSPPVTIEVSPAAAGWQVGATNQGPIAYSYTADVPVNRPFLLDLPGVDPDGDALNVQIVQGPAQAGVELAADAVLLRPVAEATGTDRIRFTLRDGSSTSNEAVVTVRYGHVACDAVKIDNAPPRQDVCWEEPVTLQVEASGTEPIEYRWRKNGSPMPGADDAVWGIAVADYSDGGIYDCVVSNACSEVVTDPVVVMVHGEPDVTIVADPATSVCAGQVVSLDAGPFEQFEWSTGETTRTIQAASGGRYSVSVVDEFGCRGAGEIELEFGSFVIWVDVELEAVRSAVSRTVQVSYGGCKRDTESFESALEVDASGAGRLMLETPEPGIEWIAVQEGHTLKRRRPIVFDECGFGQVDMTGPHRLLAGDLQSETFAQDNRIDVNDYAILSARWGQKVNPADGLGGDVNGDGVQDTSDFTAILINQLAVGDEDGTCE